MVHRVLVIPGPLVVRCVRTAVSVHHPAVTRKVLIRQVNTLTPTVPNVLQRRPPRLRQQPLLRLPHLRQRQPPPQQDRVVTVLIPITVVYGIWPVAVLIAPVLITTLASVHLPREQAGLVKP